jgi:Raf kinase inhibitor-like YbhB/YbcL family protein
MTPPVVPAIGRLLRPARAGMHKTAWYRPATRSAPDVIVVTSDAFADGGTIPQRYAGRGVGDDVSPPLTWSTVPSGAVELVLVIEDPDAPLPRPVVHCLVTGIDPRSRGLPEGALDPADDRSAGTPHPGFLLGRGSFGRRGYSGPRPVPGHGPHRYVFQVFALDTPSGLGGTVALRRTMEVVEGHVIARGKLTGTYCRG